MTVHTFTIDVLENDGTPVLSDVPAKDGAFYEDEDSDAGAFQFVIDWTKADIRVELKKDRLAVFKIDGVADRTGVIEGVTKVPVHVKPINRVVTVTGRDLLMEMDDARVVPPNGYGHPPYPSTIFFDWRHKDLDRSGWHRPVCLGPLFHADLDPFGNPWYPPMDAKPGQHPEGWPDGFTGWIWSHGVDGFGSHPVGEESYFYLPLTVTTKPLVMIYTADDQGQLAYNSALVDAGLNAPGVQWVRSWGIGIEEPEAGTIHIAGKGVNSYGSTTYNPGAFAFVAYQQASTDYLSYENCIARTGFGVNEDGNPLLGGDWLSWHGSEPGFTPGRAFRILFEAVQALGLLLDWTLDFDDTYASNEVEWETTSLLSARVQDDSLLDVIRAWHDGGFWDAWAHETDRTLFAVPYGQRGNFAADIVPAVEWDRTKLISVTAKSVR